MQNNQLMTILQEAKEQLNKASSVGETEELRVKILGKKGKLTEILRSMGSMSPEERKEFGMVKTNTKIPL